MRIRFSGLGYVSLIFTESGRVRWHSPTLWVCVLALIMVQSANAVWEGTAFYSGENFEPLIAAPKEPRFSISFQRLEGGEPLGSFNAGLVGLGENFGLMHWRDTNTDRTWEIGLTSGLVSLFKLNQRSTDLINSDFMVGLTSSFRNSNTAYRARLYHQSSHLGDEFLTKNDDVTRENFSLETLDFTASQMWGPWRAYGGGAYVIRRAKSTDVDRASVNIGGEYRGSQVLWGGSRLIAGLHTEYQEQHDWEPSVHGVVGLEFGITGAGGRRFGLQLEAYEGFSPWGQFYDVRVRTYGVLGYLRF